MSVTSKDASSHRQDPARIFRHLVGRPVLRNVLVVCLFEAAFYFAYRYGMTFSQTTASPFWFPNSVLLCALLLARPRWWGLLLLATLPIRLSVAVPPGTPMWFLLSTFAIDCGTALLSAVLLRSLVRGPTRLDSVRDLALYCLIAVMLAPITGALAGAAARSALGYDYWTTWGQWFFGNAVAALVITPVIFYWVLHRVSAPVPRGTRRIEAAIVTCGLLVTAWLAFVPETDSLAFNDSRFYAPIPFLFWAAVRFGMVGASGAIAIVTFFAVAAVLNGHGPFVGRSPAETAAGLQQFLLLRAAPLYFVAALGEQARRAGQLLSESERRFRDMADTAPVLIRTFGSDSLCAYCNKGWVDFTGRTLEQQRGTGWTESVHPEDLQRCLMIYRSSFDARQPFELDYRLRRHDGEYRWILCTGVPRYTVGGEFLGYISSAVDVTDRRTQESALRDSEERYREVVESQTDLVCRFRPDSTLTFVNEAYCRRLGHKREDLLGTSLSASFPAVARSPMQSYIELLSSQRKPCDLEHELMLPDGSTLWLHWIGYPIVGADGELHEFQAIGHDITDRMRAEAADRKLTLTSRLAAIGELTAMVAHEIKQPLSAILSNAEAAEVLLQSRAPPLDEIRQILADICKDDLRADEAIRSVRALLAKRDMQLQPMDLNEAVADVLRLTAGDATQRRVRLHHELGADLPPVSADRVYIEQVLLNLIINGMEAMSDTAEPCRELSVQTTWDGADRVEVAVRDRGHGIPPDRLPQLFESFFTTKPDGMGLGLSIARSIIQAHQGRIWAENHDAGGAVFRFSVPTLDALRRH